MATRIKLTITVYLLLAASHIVSAQELELVQRMRAALNSGSVTEVYLQDPHNSDVVALLRQRATDGDSEIQCALMKANDETVIQAVLARFALNNRAAAIAIGCAGNPRLLGALADALNRNESAERVNIAGAGEERTLRSPISVLAAFTIADLVTKSASFPPPVISWATSVINTRESSAGQHREEVRRWWTQNKEAIIAGHYEDTHPPS